MDEQIKQIAERVRGLRDALGLGIDEMAESCGLASAQYAAIESGECDLSVSSLQKIARHFDVPLDVLMFGEEPKMNAYFLTRRG
ncbi:helix-turn-helix domain-containing protein, partial [Phocaeicola coprophilus]